jgi:hypothetical protein
MIRLAWILALFVLAAVSGHFGYLRLAASPGAAEIPPGARSELAWLQRELDLTPSQLPAVDALHEEYWMRVPGLRAQLEAGRRNADATGNPAARVAAEAQCQNSTVTFIQQVTAVLTTPQREKYLGLVGSCLPPDMRTGGANVEQSPGR